MVTPESFSGCVCMWLAEGWGEPKWIVTWVYFTIIAKTININFMFSSKRHKITNEARGWPLIKSQGLCGVGVQVKIHLWHLGGGFCGASVSNVCLCKHMVSEGGCAPLRCEKKIVFLKLESWNFSLWTWPTQILHFKRNICEKFARIIKNQSLLAKIYWFWLNFVKDNVRICSTLYSIWEMIT